MRSKSYFYIAILAVALLTILNFQIKDKKSEDSCAKLNATQTVTIKDSEFIPETLTIPICTKVIFKNADSKPRWPASNIHPTHGIYPQFDPKKEIKPGGEWSFVFEKEGNWDYHDHLFPVVGGSITVGEEDKQTTQQTALLPKTELAESVKNVAKDKGATSAWQYLKENATNATQGVHDIAHFIGALLYGEQGLESLNVCDFSFAFGCFHGIVEAFISHEGIEKVNGLITSCRSLPKFQGEITCYHGLGHGLLSYFRYELNPALQKCDNLLSENYQSNCYSGVFMENALVRSLEIKSTDPQWPCNTVSQKYKSSCYDYQMIFLLKMYAGDIEKISKACSESGKQEYTETCIRGLGNYIAQRNIKDANQIPLLCNKAGGENAYRCQIAAAAELVFQRYSYEIAKEELCNSLPNPWRDTCISKIDVQKNIQNE